MASSTRRARRRRSPEQASRAAAFSARHSERLATSTPDHAGAAIVHDHDARDLYMAIQANDPAFYVEAHRGIFRGPWEQGISPRYLQSLALAGDAQVHVASEQGRPVLVEARVGQGRYLHCAMLLGRAIQRGAPGAIELFARAFERLRPALSPAVEVLAKPAMVDVSVLLGARGEPALVGITNYRTSRAGSSSGRRSTRPVPAASYWTAVTAPPCPRAPRREGATTGASSCPRALPWRSSSSTQR